MEQSKPKTQRCAVYTRKSSEEGLEQDFNSLHAHREACEAFIKSQASERWKLVKTAYDDGVYLVAPWSGLRSSACSLISVKACSTWSWSTRWTA
jgi:hypothetical protein